VAAIVSGLVEDCGRSPVASLEIALRVDHVSPPRKARRFVSDLAVGDQFGPYELEALLGEGGMGQVYRARRTGDGSIVALKVMKSALLADEQQGRRFVREGRAAHAIRHRHLVDVLEVGDVAERRYIAMRYIPGPSLADRIAAERILPVDDLVQIVAEVGSALDALHAAGVVHRDVKPSNILVDAERGALLTDFGLAKGRDYSTVTRTGQLLGTLDYIAPEILRGDEPSPSTDIYALACVTFECLAGTPPFGGNRFALGLGHLEAEPPDPMAKRNDAPATLGEIVRQALEKDPARRPPTATAFASMLIVTARSG
jgi:serine/threonine-protein kinase